MDPKLIQYKIKILNISKIILINKINFHWFRLNNKEDEQKYGKIILDYSYFNDPTEYEKIINTNPVRHVELYFIYR